MDVHCVWKRPAGWEDLEGRGQGAGGCDSWVPGMIPPLVWFPKQEEKLRATHPHHICQSNGFPFPHSESFPWGLSCLPRIAFPLPLEPLT